MSLTIRRAEGILSTQLDDSLLMLNIQKGCYHGLNPVGGRIWELLENPMTQVGLVAALLAEFEVTEAECAAEVDVFLDQLRQRGLLAESP